ncbi:hypothetical protein FE257_000974 [Aspergillus nanangensis]|uniref:DUF3752 domain-containing protein n=1 Tax=Aspergillus nanangensis TaxID=2582783 RepID=A0AAD4GX36_ASPNN|nr:hypothetical protein FE257_000974 [Aspergillus nanangensis]
MSEISKNEKRKSLESSTDNDDDAGSKRRKVIGPSFPPPPKLDEETGHEATENESSDDDDFGPSLPPSNSDMSGPHTSIGGEVIQNSPQGNSSSAQDQVGSGRAQRDDWMLRPPDASDWTSRVDPTKLRNRKFQTGKSAASRPGGEVDAAWTETPEQKMKRLQNQVMGVASQPSIASKDHGSSGSSQAIQDRIQKYKELKASQTKPVEASRSSNDDTQGDDDPSSRSFDKEKDMAIGSRITGSQRREFINKAAGFESRFAKGKYL